MYLALAAAALALAAAAHAAAAHAAAARAAAAQPSTAHAAPARAAAACAPAALAASTVAAIGVPSTPDDQGRPAPALLRPWCAYAHTAAPIASSTRDCTLPTEPRPGASPEASPPYTRLSEPTACHEALDHLCHMAMLWAVERLTPNPNPNQRAIL